MNQITKQNQLMVLTLEIFHSSSSKIEEPKLDCQFMELVHIGSSERKISVSQNKNKIIIILIKGESLSLSLSLIGEIELTCVLK